MSKRFGRNQKRRLREALATAQADAVRFKTSDEMNRGLLVYQREHIKDLESRLRDIVDIVGDGSILNPEPKVVQCDHSNDLFQATYIPSVDLDSQCSLASALIVTMRTLETKAVRDKFSGALHMRVRMANHEVRYSLSRAAVEAAPKAMLANRLHKEIARQLAVQLAEELKR